MVTDKRKIYSIDAAGEMKEKHISRRKKSTLQQFRDMKYLNVGYYLIIPLLIGVFGGAWIDKFFNTRPVFTLIGIGIGTVAMFYNLYKILKDAY